MSEYRKMKVSDLRPHPKNAEIYGQNENVSDLVEKIKRSGQVHTLVVSSNGTVLAGHRRLRACKKLGIEEVDVEIIDFDTPEQEIEYLIDNNATREKTNEQKAREAVALKETLSVLAEKRKRDKLKQNQAASSSSDLVRQGDYTDVPNLALREQSTDTPKLAERKEYDSETGKTRNIVAKKVRLKSGQEVDRAIKTVRKIDELEEGGRKEEAGFVRDVMNNRGISAAETLAKNIDSIRLTEEQKEDIRLGRKSPNSFVKKAGKSNEMSKTETKSVESTDKVKDLKDMLSSIQKRYKEYLLVFKEDIRWLSDKEFYSDDGEEVTGKTHSELQNCLEKFKGISDIMEKMIIDDFGCITIKRLEENDYE